MLDGRIGMFCRDEWSSESRADVTGDCLVYSCPVYVQKSIHPSLYTRSSLNLHKGACRADLNVTLLFIEIKV